MKLHQLRDFLAVAEHGSLRSASRALGLSQSAISKSIQALERELGAPLLERQRRGATLTAMGQLFLQRARLVTGELQKAREEIDQHLGGVVGTVVVCLSTAPHIGVLPEVLPQFIRRYPNVRLTVLEALSDVDAEKLLREGRIDFYLGLLVRSKAPAGFVLEPLFNNERIIACRVGHPLAASTSLRDLVGARWAVSTTSPVEKQLVDLFDHYRLPVPTHITSGTNILAQMVFVLQSDMLALVPRQWVDFAAMRGLVQRAPVKEFVGAPPIGFLRRADLPLTPAAEHFCNLARRVASRMPIVKVPKPTKGLVAS